MAERLTETLASLRAAEEGVWRALELSHAVKITRCGDHSIDDGLEEAAAAAEAGLRATRFLYSALITKVAQRAQREWQAAQTAALVAAGIPTCDHLAPTMGCAECAR